MSSPKDIPETAVIGGFDQGSMEPTFIIRAWYQQKLIPGKAFKTGNQAFVSHGGTGFTKHDTYDFPILTT